MRYIVPRSPFCDTFHQSRIHGITSHKSSEEKVTQFDQPQFALSVPRELLALVG